MPPSADLLLLDLKQDMGFCASLLQKEMTIWASKIKYLGINIKHDLGNNNY